MLDTQYATIQSTIFEHKISTHMVPLTQGASSTPGVLGSTHSGTQVTTPLTHGVASTHGVSLIPGVSVTHGASSIHGVSFAHGVALTHALALPLCVRRSTHFSTLVSTHVDTTHTGTTTLGNRVPTRVPGASIPPKLRVHSSTALAPSTPLGTTEPTWS